MFFKMQFSYKKMCFFFSTKKEKHIHCIPLANLPYISIPVYVYISCICIYIYIYIYIYMNMHICIYIYVYVCVRRVCVSLLCAFCT